MERCAAQLLCGDPAGSAEEVAGRLLAILAVASFAHLVQVIRHGLKKIQYRPGLIEGCLAGTGVILEPGKTPTDITN